MGGALYDTGYDVHLYSHQQVTSKGCGTAYDELTSAVLQRNVDDVAIVGYSWGGGATYDLSAALQANSALRSAGYQLQFTAYVDGIRHGSLSAEIRLPPGTHFHENFYQRRDPFIRNNSVTRANNLYVTATDWGATLVHTSIDDSATLRELLRGDLRAHVGV